LLFYDVSLHYHVITNLTAAMSKRYVCRACNKGCDRGVSHLCDQSCSDCMASPPCASVSGVCITCGDYNRHFRSRSCYDNHKNPPSQQAGSGRTVCEQKKCGKCGALITLKRHECNKRWCGNCGENRENGHLCFMRHLRNALPASDTVLFVLYDFATTQVPSIQIRPPYTYQT